MQQLGVSLNAVHLHDVFEDDVNVHMIMELCEGGALLERVESGVYSEKYISRLVRSILRFIAQCHAKVSRLLHLDRPFIADLLPDKVAHVVPSQARA